MDSEILALVDRDKDYLEKFNNYINLKYGGIFECHSFTDTKALLKYGLENDITVLMIESELYNESLNRINPGKIYILGDEGQSPSDDNVIKISRFKSADSIIKEVLSEVRIEGNGNIKVSDIDSSRIFIVYSPVSRCLKTTLSVTISQLLSDRGKTLYINTESISGFNRIFMSHYDTDLSDLLFYLKGGSTNFSLKLQSMVFSSQGYDYIPPGVSPEDICQTEPEIWEELFREAAKCGYEYIVMDMGNYINGMLEIMKKCEKIFMPVRTDTVSKAKLSQFEALLHISGSEDILNLMERLQLPYFEGLPSIAADLRMSPIAEFIKGRLF